MRQEWINDKLLGGGMTIEKINTQLNIQEKELKKRCGDWWDFQEALKIKWAKMGKEPQDKYEQRLDYEW